MLHTSPNTFGRSLRVITFGESHGTAVGLVIDGVKPGLPFDLTAIQQELDLRRPGQSDLVTSRSEKDLIQVLSGVFEEHTTGHPIAMVVFNENHQIGDYEAIKHIFRPGHADFTYDKKYGFRDYRGGGRASGRETLARVAAGAWAKQQLTAIGVAFKSFNREIAGIACKVIDWDFVQKNPLRVCDPGVFHAQRAAVEAAMDAKDSVGGISEIHICGLPVGLGDPVFSKLDAMLAYACMSIGGVKGVEFGAGFEAARMCGSQHNDAIANDSFCANNAGGILGGISNGDVVILRLAVKPTSSIGSRQKTIDWSGQEVEIEIQGRHDPCIAPRLLPVAEAMCALAIYDAWLTQSELMPETVSDISDYDWDSIEEILLKIWDETKK
ncbi:MAG: chorismate synthase [Holophagales bacterium]|jgi:chorismate synthase|nr:chorismate synthase [Holophagales bacterium]